MNILQQPAKIHTAFNPILLSMQQPHGMVEQAVVRLSAHGQTISMEREFLNWQVTFDLSSVVKGLFRDETKSLNGTLVYEDYNLVVPYQVEIDNSMLNVPNEKFSFYAINAVAQLGEMSNLEHRLGSFCTQFDRLISYKGYPQTLTCLNYLTSSSLYLDKQLKAGRISNPLYTIDLPEGTQHVRIRNDQNNAMLTDDDGRVLTDSQGNILYALINGYEECQKHIDQRPVPDNPFYVRWINQQGGWDYWMFSHRQTVKRDIANVQRYTPTVFDPETGNATFEVYHKEGTESITVGADGLNENEYECVSRLVYSPRIDYYDKGKDKWLRLTVEEGASENDTRSPGKQVEFIFLLPTPQLQF